MHRIVQNGRNTILLKWVKKISKFLPKKLKKSIFRPKIGKMTEKSKIFQQMLLVWFDLEWSKMCLKLNIKFEIFLTDDFSGT